MSVLISVVMNYSSAESSTWYFLFFYLLNVCFLSYSSNVFCCELTRRMNKKSYNSNIIHKSMLIFRNCLLCVNPYLLLKLSMPKFWFLELYSKSVSFTFYFRFYPIRSCPSIVSAFYFEMSSCPSVNLCRKEIVQFSSRTKTSTNSLECSI